MKKSLIALLLVVALVVTVSVFAASAETTNPFEGQTGDVTAYCAACDADVVWKPVDKALAEKGTQVQNWADTKAGATHFYFAEDMKMGTTHNLTTEKFCFELNGKTVTRSSGNPFFRLCGEDETKLPELNLFDSSAEETGKLVIPFAGGSVFELRFGGTMNVYGGNYVGSGIEGGKGVSTSSGTAITTTNNGIKGADGKIADTTHYSDAVVNLYGGYFTGKSMYSGGLISLASGATVNIDGAELEGWCGGDSGGVIRLNHKDAKVTMKSGSLTGGLYSTASGVGAAIVVDGGATLEVSGGTIDGLSPKTGGAIYAKNGNVTISGGEISGTAGGGGAIMMDAGELTISGGTITGKTTGKNSGGSIRVKGTVNATISGGTITGGAADDANGGNIYWASTGTLTMTGGEITKGTALRVNGTSNGNAGNLYMDAGTFNMEGGTISGGLDTNNSAHAGNLYLAAGVTFNMTGGTITGGKTANYGGNIYAYGANVNIDAAEGKTVKISDGKGSAGGNLYLRTTDAAGTFTITGPDVSITGGDDGAKTAAGSLTTQCGSYIMLYGTEKNPAVLNIADVTIDSSEVHTTELALYTYATLNVSGAKTIDTVYIVNLDTCQVNVQEGYTGNLFVRWFDADTAKAVKAGATIHSSLKWADGYADTGIVKACDNSRSAKTLAQIENNLFAVAAFGGFKWNAETETFEETPLGAMPTEAGKYDFIRPYFNNPITLGCDTVLDINNGVYEVTTNGFKLGVIECRSSDFQDVKAEGSTDLLVGCVTVDDETKLQPVAQLSNGDQYLLIPQREATTGTVTYTARRVKVDIASVSIKPATAAMYYTTNMDTSPMASALVKKYGVVLSLADMPGADFATDDANGDGTLDNLWTEIAFELGEDERMAIEGANSALLEDILIKDAPAGQNKAWGEMPIYANAYVCFEIDGKEVYVMADKTYDLSLLDILAIVDATMADNAGVQAMYKTWQDPMAIWAQEGKLANIAAAANA